MTFASATIQGKVMWIDFIMGGKEENRPTTQMIISVPDKRSRTETEDGIRDPLWSRGLGDVYMRQLYLPLSFQSTLLCLGLLLMRKS